MQGERHIDFRSHDHRKQQHEIPAVGTMGVSLDNRPKTPRLVHPERNRPDKRIN
jgi:hypothetical protein